MWRPRCGASRPGRRAGAGTASRPAPRGRRSPGGASAAGAGRRRPRSTRPWPASRNRCSTSSDTASGVVRRATAMALIGWPSAIKVRSSSSAALRSSSPGCTGPHEGVDDGRVEQGAAGGHGADGVDELVALGQPVLQQVGVAGGALAEQGHGVLGVVVLGEDHDAGAGVAACGSPWRRRCPPAGRSAACGCRRRPPAARCSAAAASSSGWSAASPTTSTSASRARRARTPARTMRLSSASTTVIAPSGMCDHLSHDPAARRARGQPCDRGVVPAPPPDAGLRPWAGGPPRARGWGQAAEEGSAMKIESRVVCGVVDPVRGGQGGDEGAVRAGRRALRRAAARRARRPGGVAPARTCSGSPTTSGAGSRSTTTAPSPATG